MTEQLTRREFARDMGTLAFGTALVVPFVGENHYALTAESGKRNPNTMQPACDFQASFMTWDLPPHDDPRTHARHKIPHGNLARIQLEALIDVFEDAEGNSERFVLIAPCRTEWVYAEDRLFQIPSAEYRNIYSLTEERSLRRAITAEGNPSPAKPVLDTFRSIKIDVNTFSETRALTDPAQIVEATGKNLSLNGRTEIRDPERKQRYILEYPIKTMNFQPKDNSFQVDTGPVLVPDFKSQATRTIETLEMAHVAYNRLDRAEFILRRPTPVEDKQGRELCKVLHYSEIHESEAETVILAGGSE